MGFTPHPVDKANKMPNVEDNSECTGGKLRGHKPTQCVRTNTAKLTNEVDDSHESNVLAKAWLHNILGDGIGGVPAVCIGRNISIGVSNVATLRLEIGVVVHAKQ